MHVYGFYKEARDVAWKILIECGITELPVDLTTIAKHYNYPIITYSKSSIVQAFNTTALTGDGFIAKVNDDNNQKIIFINDKIGTYERRRFTLGHEIGHGVMNHDLSSIHYRHSEMDYPNEAEEYQANIVSRDILMPATVLAALNIHTPEEIIGIMSHKQKISRNKSRKNERAI